MSAKYKYFPITYPEGLTLTQLGIGTAELSEIDTGIIPYILGSIETRCKPSAYSSPVTASLVIQAIRRYEVSLLMGIGADIANSLDRLYTLTEAAHFGYIRPNEGLSPVSGRIVYNPAIPDSPAQPLAQNTNANITAILQSISGASNPAELPLDNLLTALRGLQPSGAERNVIDALKAQVDPEQQAELFEELLKLAAFLMA